MNIFQTFFLQRWQQMVSDPALPFGPYEHERRHAYVCWRETKSDAEFETWWVSNWRLELAAVEIPAIVWGDGPHSWDRRAAWMAYEAIWAAENTPQPTEQLSLF